MVLGQEVRYSEPDHLDDVQSPHLRMTCREQQRALGEVIGDVNGQLKPCEYHWLLEEWEERFPECHCLWGTPALVWVEDAQ